MEFYNSNFNKQGTEAQGGVYSRLFKTDTSNGLNYIKFG